MGIIDQWGNGLKLIADELKEYPQIEFRWIETGLSFQVQFIKLDYVAKQELSNQTMNRGNTSFSQRNIRRVRAETSFRTTKQNIIKASRR